MNGQRVLTALVFTDAVAFSTRVQQDEESALREMQADFDTMRQVAEAHSGRVLKTMGDGLLMVFDSAALAVDAALEIQRQFGERPAGGLQHRMGVHLSDVVMEEHDVHGDGVNLAARLEAEASPGGICLSQTIYDIVKSRLPVQAKFLGERHLKNLVEPVNVFEIAPSNAPRGQRIPAKGPVRPRGNYAVAGALVFLGCTILAFAAMQAMKPTVIPSTIFVKREPKPDTPSGTRVKLPPRGAPHVSGAAPTRPTPSTQTPQPKPEAIQTAKPAVPEAKPPTPPATPKAPAETGGSEGLIASPKGRPTLVSIERDPDYRRAAHRFAKTYDFKGMREWLEEQETYKDRPELPLMLEKWGRLEALMTRLESDLGTRTADEALRVAFPLSRGKNAQTEIWGAEDGKIEVLARNGRSREFEVRKLDPAAIRALVMASAREKGDLKEIRPLLATFDEAFFSQYGGTFRKVIRTGTGKGNLPPNVPFTPPPGIMDNPDRSDTDKTGSATTG
jgi:class 3 adenylate cyclase